MPGPVADDAWVNPGPEGSNLKVSEFLTLHLLRLANLAKSTVAREYLDPVGLTAPEWRLLSMVVNFSPIAFADLTVATSMDKGQVSRTLRLVQTKGFVNVELVPVDRKSVDATVSSISRVVVSVSPAGMEIYHRVMPLAQRFQAGLIELLSPEERSVMLRVLQRLHSHLQKSAMP
jgi:DNA-binding MarR family transcriptional regulator